MAPNEVFLSHSSEDQVTARRIAQTLVAHGVPIFYSPENIVGAQQWLTLFQMVDLTDDFASGCRDLLQTWGIGFDPRHLPP